VGYLIIYPLGISFDESTNYFLIRWRSVVTSFVRIPSQVELPVVLLANYFFLVLIVVQAVEFFVLFPLPAFRLPFPY